MYSDTTHQLNGKPATATLMEHIKTCTVEYQRIGQEPRKDPMACDAAEQFQRLIGANKIKVSHAYLARVQFHLENGRRHEATVEESKLDSHRLPLGTQLAVVYAPGNPADVRAVMSWERLKVPLILLAAGLVFLMLAFGGHVAALIAWAFRGRTSAAEKEPAPGLEATVKTPRRSATGASSLARLRTPGLAPRTSFGMRK
jgi:hypothetical protein